MWEEGSGSHWWSSASIMLSCHHFMAKINPNYQNLGFILGLVPNHSTAQWLMFQTYNKHFPHTLKACQRFLTSFICCEWTCAYGSITMAMVTTTAGPEFWSWLKYWGSFGAKWCHSPVIEAPDPQWAPPHIYLQSIPIPIQSPFAAHSGMINAGCTWLF